MNKMQYLISELNKNCHFNGDLYQCKWSLIHFGEKYTRNYCFNYENIFKLCDSCNDLSQRISSMISSKDLVFLIIQKQQEEITKLKKDIKNTRKILGKSKKKSKKIKVPMFINEIEYTDSTENVTDSITIEPPYTSDYCVDSSQIELIPKKAEFKEEIEMINLDGTSIIGYVE